METVFYNSIWMPYNLCLGAISVVAGWLAVKHLNFWLRMIFGFIWFIFIPNTLYMLIDITHLVEQFNASGVEIKSLLLFQYGLLIFLAVVFFVCSLYPFEEVLVKIFGRRKDFILPILIVVNFVIGFGVAMGVIERVNSWEVVTNTTKVFDSSINVATSLKPMILAIFFGIVGNIIYFPLKATIIKYSYYVAEKVFKIRAS